MKTTATSRPGPRKASTSPRDRWRDITRTYSKEEVERLRPSVQVEHTLARLGAARLWDLLHTEPCVRSLGALSGQQAVQMVRAGLKAIYCSGWQVAADANLAGQTYPDLSLYPANSVPHLVKRINQALQRADQIARGAGARMGAIGMRRSSPTPRPVSAAPSTPSKS